MLKLQCFMNVPFFLPAQKGTPPAKADLMLVPPERHGPLHLPVRADLVIFDLPYLSTFLYFLQLLLLSSNLLM